jgi:hypothetical protein
MLTRAHARSLVDQQVVGFVDEHTRDAGEIVQGPQMSMRGAINDVDPVRARVGDVEPSCPRINVSMVEAWLLAGRKRDEVDSLERHRQPLAPASTSCRHQA